MHTTEPFTPTASRRPTLGDMVAEIVPIVSTVFVAGPPVLAAWAGTVLFALMLAGPFALLVTFVLVVVAAVGLVMFAGAIVASPYLLVRYLVPRLAERRRVAVARAPIAPAVARTGRAVTRHGLAVLTHPTTLRTSR
jgi:hypothetical protein